MSDESLELVKRFKHMLYDRCPTAYALWYPDCKCFNDLYEKHVRKQKDFPEPDWEQMCEDRGLVEFWPYSKEVIDLKLAVMGY